MIKKETSMIQFETPYAGLNLKSPILIGSSGLTKDAKRNKEFEEHGAGAVVLKSLFEEEIHLHSESMMTSSDYPEAADYLQNYVKSDQLEKYVTLIKETKAICTIPVIASVNCFQSDSWIDYAKQFEEAGADALELNIFYLFTELDFSYDKAIQQYVSILQKVKKVVSIPIIIKIGKYFSNIPALVNQLKIAGASGVVLFNRFHQADIDIQSLKLVSGEVFSHHSELSDTLRWTAFVSGKVPGISVSSSTGVHEWEDVIKCIAAGASTVQLCSAVYSNGSKIISQMLDCMDEWMKQSNYRSLAEIRGKLSFSNVTKPALYERYQFMKYFSNREE